jgi:hypothetical protein
LESRIEFEKKEIFVGVVELKYIMRLKFSQFNAKKSPSEYLKKHTFHLLKSLEGFEILVRCYHTAIHFNNFDPSKYFWEWNPNSNKQSSSLKSIPSISLNLLPEFYYSHIWDSNFISNCDYRTREKIKDIIILDSQLKFQSFRERLTNFLNSISKTPKEKAFIFLQSVHIITQNRIAFNDQETNEYFTNLNQSLFQIISSYLDNSQVQPITNESLSKKILNSDTFLESQLKNLLTTTSNSKYMLQILFQNFILLIFYF